ncbi:Nn.00g097600.m01.CDS01 [Neocucurbitaria sp. VM-36]
MRSTSYSSSRGGTNKTAGRDRRPRISSVAPEGLLGRQLASIADTLAKASQRREGELHDRKMEDPIATPAEQEFWQNLSVTSRPMASSDNDFDKSRADHAQLQKEFGEVAMRSRTFIDMAKALGDCHPQAILRGGYEPHGDTDPKRMLADLNRTQEFSSKFSNDEANGEDNPRQMLAELERQASSLNQKVMDDPCRMLADLDRETKPSGRNLANDNDDDLEALRSRLTTMLSPSHHPDRKDAHLPCSIVPDHSNSGIEVLDSHTMKLDKKIIPYAVAFELEESGYKWEVVKGWTTYIFSSGLDGQVAQEQKDAMVMRATEELERIIQHTMKEELHRREREDTERIAGRLIVSNLASDASEDELRRVFYQYRFDIRDIVLLEERDSIRRTRVAHIDMWTRKAAIRASYHVGHIFGLCLSIRLAIPA